MITGAVVSETVTFCVAVALFPFASVAVQVTTVVPIANVAGASDVIVTPNASVAVADPIATVVALPVASAATSAGAVITGAVVSATVIVTMSEADVAVPSLTIKVIALVPAGSVTVGFTPVAVPNGPLQA